MTIVRRARGGMSGCRMLRRGNAPRLALLSAGCALALVQVAHAQDAAAASQAAELDTIVVVGDRAETGTKTDTKLVEIPQSISVVTAEQFTDRTATNFQEIFRYSAGVATELEGVDTRVDRISSRGFSAAQYLDGLNRSPDGIYGARMEVFTLERAEVLRGPSSVLYGAGGVGGLMNAVSKTPSHAFGGEVGLVVGDPMRRELQFDLTGGNGDTVAGRIVALKRDGELQWDDQADDRLVLMPSVKWTLGDATDITLLALYQKDELGTQSFLPMSRTLLGTDANRLPMDFFSGDKGFNRMDTEYRSLTLMVDHAFSDRVSFGSRTRHYDHEVEYAELWAAVATPWQGADGNLLPREFYMLGETYDGLNSDNSLSFRFDTGAFEHRVLAGIDYTLFKQDRQEGFSCSGLADQVWEDLYGCYAGGSPPPLDVTNPNYYEDIDAGYTNAYTTRSTQLGVYVQDQIRYRDRVSLVLGARRDRSTSEASGVEEPDSYATTYRVGVIGELANGVSPYVSYSESFQPVFGGDFFGNPFKPREGRQYEAGVKWQVNPAALLSVSVFDIVDSNYVVQDPDFLQNFIQIGEVSSSGYEFEANGRLAGIDLTASYSHVDAEDPDGNRVAAIPERSASAWATKAVWLGDELRMRFGGGVRYVGDKIDSTLTHVTSSVTVADAMVDFEYRNWKFGLNVSNLFDKEFFVYCLATAPGEGACYPGTPRTVLASVRYSF